LLSISGNEEISAVLMPLWLLRWVWERDVFSYDVGHRGSPYFVMELVRGIKLTDYCDQHSLSTRERLDLFAEVCRPPAFQSVGALFASRTATLTVCRELPGELRSESAPRSLFEINCAFSAEIPPCLWAGK